MVSTGTVKTKLIGVPETLLITVYFRAKESLHKNGILKDSFSEDWVSRIEYDFEKFDDDRLSQLGTIIRTEILDEIVLQFMEENPNGIIVNLGVGLGTRFLRLDNGSINWFELDMPESIELREQFVQPTERYRFISKSAFDHSWIDDVSETVRGDNGKILIITEGTLMYFEEAKVKALFGEIKAHFPSAEVVTDTIAKLAVNNAKRHKTVAKLDAEFKWGVNKVKELDAWNFDIEVIKEYYFMSRHPKRWGILGWFRFIPFLKRMARFIHFKFGDK
ncbi:class I SAM-dependent methyltransferase [bacterium]|nr:class I SAM-dependent methyltransferase [bacterium]